MTLRTALINLREEDITDKVFVITKKTNTEINTIVNEILDEFHNEKISLFETHRKIVDELSEGVNKSSYKQFNYTIDFDSK